MNELLSGCDDVAMRLFGRTCPVADTERVWIEESLAWLHGEFGDDVLNGPVVLPTEEFFPGEYTGQVPDVRGVVDRVCDHMGVERARIELEFVDDLAEAEALARWGSRSHGAAGLYEGKGDRALVAISAASARNSTSLVATIAHELGHQRLLGEGRIDRARRDHEPLTDLLTVYFGMGIFSANAAFDFSQHSTGWRYGKQGYLTELMYGYALACYTRMRNESTPDWAGYLDTNPRGYLKRSLRYLDGRPTKPG